MSPSISSSGTSSTSTTIVNDFLLTLQAQVPTFVQSVEAALWSDHTLDVSTYEADHVCWRTETWEEYEALVGSLKQQQQQQQDSVCKLLIESNIGGRPIATASLHEAIIVPSRATATASISTKSNSRSIQVIEIPAPKEGSFYKRGLEHVEFVIGDSTTSSSTTFTSNNKDALTPKNDHRHQSILEDFMKEYPSIPWNTKAKSKNVNPDISLKVYLKKDFGQCSVKFHLMPLAEVIAYEKKHDMV